MNQATDQGLTPTEIEALFTRTDGQFLCARWGRAICPTVFGVDDATLAVVKGAFQTVCQNAGHEMGDMDAELGTNTMVFFFRDWAELIETPDLDKLVPELGPLVDRLQDADASQYRFFRFDKAGAIKAAFAFVRMDRAMSKLPAETIALSQAVQTILLWSDQAFTARPALATTPDGATVVQPEIAQVIRAAYDPVLPSVSDQPTHALRLSARIAMQP